MVRYLTSLAVLAAGLAACSPQPAKTPVSQSAEAPAPITETAPNTIPAAFTGKWNDKAELCGGTQAKETEVDISPDSLNFAESKAKVQVVTVNDPTNISIDAIFTTADMSSRGQMTLALEDDGKKLLINKGIGGVKYRCQ